MPIRSLQPYEETQTTSRSWRASSFQQSKTLLLVVISFCLRVDVPLFAQRGPALVEIVPVTNKVVSAGQTFVGTVTPSRTAAVGSAVDGRVVKFHVNEGDRVKQGDALAELLTETIKLELEAAEAELALRVHELAELENGSRPGEIEQARAAMEAAKATSEFRDSNRERSLALYKQRGAATSQQVDEAISMATAAREAYAAAKAHYELTVEGPRPELILQAEARKAMQSALVKKLKDQIKKHTVISRFDGYVVAEHTEEGQWVSRGDLVAEVVALDQVDIEAQVVESQIPFVEIGASVRVSVPALPTNVFTGNIVSVTPQADPRSRTFPVKIRIKNEFNTQNQPLLKAGMLAQVYLATGRPVDAQLVPKDALVLGGGNAMIWIVDKQQAKQSETPSMTVAPATMVPVKLGVSDGNLIEVIGEIPADSSVVVLGNERIQPSRGPDPTMVQWVSQKQQNNSKRASEP